MPARPPPKQNSGYAALSGSIAVPPFGEHILHSRDTSRIVFVKRGHSISRDLWSHAQLREENTWPGKLCSRADPSTGLEGPGQAASMQFYTTVAYVADKGCRIGRSGPERKRSHSIEDLQKSIASFRSPRVQNLGFCVRAKDCWANLPVIEWQVTSS